MKIKAFASRNAKEILRDRLSLFFGLGFPLVLLVLLSLIQSNVPVPIFEIEHLAPGIGVFGLSFIALFSGVLIAKDRTSSFMLRLFTSPMRSRDFIMGYTLPLLPMAVAQLAVTYIAAFALGLRVDAHVLLAMAASIPAAVLYIALGLLCGSLFTEKQVGGLCGALLTNLTAWLSGTWFDLSLVGKGFQRAADLLPFSHAVNAGRYALDGAYAQILPELLWVGGYALALFALAAMVFHRRMHGE